jgi:hypothetical protein
MFILMRLQFLAESYEEREGVHFSKVEEVQPNVVFIICKLGGV